MIENYISNLEPKATVNLLKTLSKASDFELPIIALLTLAIIPGFLDELGAALAIGGLAVLIRVIRKEVSALDDEIMIKLVDAAIIKTISKDELVDSIKFLKQSA